MNRLLKLFVLAVIAAAFSMTTLANGPLPLPADPAVKSTPKYIIVTHGPSADGAISIASPLMWEDIGAESYKITFKIVATGQKITWRPQFTCMPYCMNDEVPMTLFDVTRDGDEVQWWVSTKVNDVKYKSVKLTTFVNEIDPVTIGGPAEDMVVPRDNFLFILWFMQPSAIQYKLVVKNADTGSVVLKRAIASNVGCSAEELMCGFIFGGANPTAASLFEHGTAYKWRVVTTGISGEKAKSQVFRFSSAGYTD